VSAELTAQEPSAKYLVSLQPPLVRHFDLIAQAPGGVARLRELILTLAVQGKLVPQDPSDEPASELLKKIRAEKDRLIAEGKIKRDKPLDEIADQQKPFELPDGWIWTSLAAVGIINPRNDAADEAVASFVQMSSIPVQFSEAHAEELRPWNAIKSGFTHFAEGDVGVAKITPCFENGKSTVFRNLSNGIGAGTTELHIVRPLGGIDPRYVLLFLKTPTFLKEGEAVMTGSAGQKRLPRSYFENKPFSLPPLIEQSRIVTRVEELMQVCDALEASGQLEAQQHAQLADTLLGTLTQSETPEALADNWQRIATHFDVLLDRPEAVDALEQTILQLAVRGLLVPQDPTDEPASVLLQKIRTEKDHLITQGKIKRDKPLPPITDEEKPFELPQGWEWVRVADLCSMVTDGEHLTPTRCDDATQVPLVTAKNVRHEIMDYRVTDYVPRDVAEKCWQRCKPLVGDILMVSVGATLGRLCVLREPLDMVLVRSVTVLRPVHVGVSVDFFALRLMSQDSQAEIWREVKQSAQPCLYLAKSAALKIAFPPLAEQSRIVTRVNELRSLCADLRQRLAALQSGQKQLAQALIENAGS
jgi:type I restriction enzyme, S subunit